MAAILYTLGLLALVAHIPAQTNACTKEDMNTCMSGAHYHGDFCEFHQETADCLEEVKETCTDDALLEEIESHLGYRKDLGSRCTGMPHNCVMDALAECDHDVPVNVKNLVNYSISGKKRDCAVLKPKESQVRQCFKAIETNCSSGSITSIVDRHVSTLDDILAICDDLD